MSLQLCSSIRNLSSVGNPGISDVVVLPPICKTLHIDRREVSGYVQQHGRLAARISPRECPAIQRRGSAKPS